MLKTVIDASKKNVFPDLKELYHYKDLIYTLVEREYKTKYAQSYLGALWAIARPTVTILIFIFVFSFLARVQAPIPYPVFVLIGLSAWQYFSTTLTSGGESIVANASMIKKIYFPRLALPLSKTIVAFIDLIIVLIALVIVMLFYQMIPSWKIIFLPLFILQTAIVGLGAATWVTSLSIRFRDVQYMLPLIIQIGMYLTPVAYPLTLIPEKFQLIYCLNPLVFVIEGFRLCFIGEWNFQPIFLVSMVLGWILLYTSLLYFNKVDKFIADTI